MWYNIYECTSKAMVDKRHSIYTNTRGGMAMFLRKNHSNKTGRTHLAIVQGYRSHDGKSRQRTVQKVGYLDELEKIYDDPIAHFTAIAAEMGEAHAAAKRVPVELDMDAALADGAACRKNYGHAVLSKVYHGLEIDRFLKNARRHETFEFNTDAIMRLLVFSRILWPGSKRAAELGKGRLFDSFKFSLDDVYAALTHFDKIGDALQRHIHAAVVEKYGRDTSLVYYDTTNYYFEVDKQDDLRKRGAEKNHRRDPIVQMGLLLDRAGLPVTYRIFPGNTHDSQTLMPVLTEVKKRFGVGRIVVVADKGLNSGDNIAYNTILGDGYVYSKSVRGASDSFKKWALSESGWRKVSDEYRIKSKLVPDVEISVTVGQIGKKKTKKKEHVEQKWIVFYSEKYAVRSRRKRDEAVAKAKEMIKAPAKYKSTFDRGATGYIENIKFDKDTGEISNVGETLVLNCEKIAEEEKYDGYYAIVTSELDEPDESVIDMYRGLWRIEESFKATKSTLGARPVFLQTEAHINAHFLVCFVALLILRIVEMGLGGKYTVERIAETLRKVECSHVERNIWLFDFFDDVMTEMNAAFGTNFGKKFMTLGEIKKNLGQAKKG
jgi:transposase